MQIYSYEEAYNASLKYFKGDDLAAKVWIDKYALKDKNSNIYEKTPDDMHRRLAKEFARIEQKYPNPLSEEEIYLLLKDFKYIVPQGSPMYGIGNDFQLTSISNCFFVGSNEDSDSYGSIMRTDEEIAQIYKRRGGCGIDLSHYRPSGSIASGSILDGVSGSTLYMERFSNTTREVAQSNRRGALMQSISIKHPDAEKFIDKKLDLNKVTGANISVKVSDEFMEAVKNDCDFIHTYPIDLKLGDDLINQYYEYDKLYNYKDGYIKVIKARKLWDKLIINNHKMAEPGVLFWDKFMSESPSDCYSGHEIKGLNPCFTGDTIIAVADGRNGVSIKDLANKNKKFLVYSAKKKNKLGWKTEIKEAIAFKTGIKKIFKIVLSNGSTFKCTGDHLLARPNGEYIEAKNSKGFNLENFFTFSDKNSNKSYRHINSISNGYSRQYRMLWEYYNGKYDGKVFNIDHIDDDSTNDKMENLELLTIKEHKIKTKRYGENNPIQKIKGSKYLSLYSKRSNIQANGEKYKWSREKINIKLKEFDLKYGEELKFFKPNDKNIYLNLDVKVEEVIELKEEEVYDLTVKDNHNFYIITKTDDDKYLNSCGVLVHNCGEISLPNYDSCRLMAINLYSYIENPFTPEAKFNFELFINHVQYAQRLMDDLVDLEIEKLDKIIEKINNDSESDNIKWVELNLWRKIRQKAIEGRRTGLGITAEGDMLAALGLKYGNEETTKFAVEIHKQLAINSYKSSVNMAKERGSFPIWTGAHKEYGNPFIRRIFNQIDPESPACIAHDIKVVNNYYIYGRRNIANLTIAPTGSVSLLTQTTSGIEPVFLPIYKRRRKTNDPKKSVFIDEVGDMWEEYVVFHPKFIEWYSVVSNINDFEKAKFALENTSQDMWNKLYKESPYYKATSADVDWKESVRMQGEIQKWIDHSISKTINLPKDTSIETVDELYRTAYEVGCKGVTIYREGSRSGVLISNSENSSNEEEIVYSDSPKRPKELFGDIYTKTVLGKKWTIWIGLLKGKPYEVMAFEQLEQQEFPKEITKGILSKIAKKHYRLVGQRNNKEYTIDNIIPLMSPDEQFQTKDFSRDLRHGIKPKYIISDIDDTSYISSFRKAIGRVLKNYLTGKDLEEACPECGDKLVYQEGCLKCSSCSYSKCG